MAATADAGGVTGATWFRWAGMPVLLVVWWGLVLAFAFQTPPWQAPDEPAHFNYVRDLGQGRLPVQQETDWDQAYQALIVTRGFPEELSIDSIRYEGHQPPLYYAWLVPGWLLTRDGPLERQAETVRVLSALLALPMLALAWQVARRVLREEWLALAAVGFVALLPQQLAILGSANNDTLAQLVAVSLLLWSVWLVQRPPGPGVLPARWLVTGAVLVAVTLLAKTTAYPSLALVPLALLLVRDRVGWRGALLSGAIILGAGALLATPWFGRNLVEYGWPDVLGQIRHDAIVVGQPGGRLDTVQGWSDTAYIGFRSFFVQLGWMAVPAQDRVYQVLLVLTGLSLAGLVLLLLRTRPVPRVTWLLLASFGLVLLAVLYYNLRFFQPQGRYLFVALPAIAIGLMAGAAGLFPGRWRPVLPVVWLAALLWVDYQAVTDLIPRLSP